MSCNNAQFFPTANTAQVQAPVVDSVAGPRPKTAAELWRELAETEASVINIVLNNFIKMKSTNIDTQSWWVTFSSVVFENILCLCFSFGYRRSKLFITP
jgi:hypothetical protein